MKDYTLKISTPDGDAFSGSALSLSVRGTEGELGILAGHAPFVTAVVPCRCRLIEAAQLQLRRRPALRCTGRQIARSFPALKQDKLRKLNTVFFTTQKIKADSPWVCSQISGRPLFSTFSRHSV